MHMLGEISQFCFACIFSLFLPSNIYFKCLSKQDFMGLDSVSYDIGIML